MEHIVGCLYGKKLNRKKVTVSVVKIPDSTNDNNVRNGSKILLMNKCKPSLIVVVVMATDNQQ